MSKFIQSLFVTVLFLFILSACNTDDSGSLGQIQSKGIQFKIRSKAEFIAQEVTREGPMAWLKFFSHDPQFFMANEGKLVFPNYDSAAAFVQSFAKGVKSIQLTWSDINVDPLSENFAVMRAEFHEVITDTAGHQMPVEGYFTGLFVRTTDNWLLRNLHWSTAGQGR